MFLFQVIECQGLDRCRRAVRVATVGMRDTKELPHANRTGDRLGILGDLSEGVEPKALQSLPGIRIRSVANDGVGKERKRRLEIGGSNGKVDGCRKLPRR